MKKTLSLVLAFLASVIAMANPIDQKKAETIARGFLAPGHELNLVTRAVRTPSKMAKLNAAVANTSPYYIYSRGENKGFVIVSGDDCLPEVLGYTEQGNFDPNDMPPALKDMLDYFAMAVEEAQANGTNTTCDEVQRVQRAAATRVNIAPFVTAHWHQSSPYNDRCPIRTGTTSRAVTGCVATAASQILYYWRRDLPSTLQASTPTYGYGEAPVTESMPKGMPLKWALMRDQYGSEPSEYKQAVADFVFATGAATWLTYGASTGGNIEKIPYTFSAYYGMNGGTVKYRDSYSQENWTQLLYDELIAGRPVMYTGQHPTNGGHAVFIHGYQASTDKFYFNFGWGAGNGYDGYYTTTQTDGMNGFSGQQSALFGAYPKKWNMTATLQAPEHVYANIDNVFKVKIENYSTLPQSGFYLFASTSKTNPTNLSNAKSSDVSSVVAVDGSLELKLTAKPTTVNTWYITLTDKSLRVLSQVVVDTELSEANLTANSIGVYGKLEQETIAGNQYTVVANNKATVYVDVTNSSDAAYGGSAKLDVYSSKDGGETFTLLKSTSLNNILVPGNEKSRLDISVTSLDANLLYKVMVNDTWGTGATKTSVDVSQVAPVYFKLTGKADLKATLEEDLLKFVGTWDPSLFKTTVTANANKSALNYDLTAVEGVGMLPDIDYPNPNALIFAPAGASGTNVVTTDGQCSNLNLTVGYPFQPRDNFRAKKASLKLGDIYNNWNIITVPFDCELTDGMMARHISGHSSNGIASKLTAVTTLEAGCTYLLINADKEFLLSAGENVNVEKSPKVNTDPSIIGTYTTVEVPNGAKVIGLNTSGNLYFVKAKTGTEALPLMGYFYDEAQTSIADFRAFADTKLDPEYMKLATAIRNLCVLQQENMDVVTPEANAIMNDTIANAEHRFSVMEFSVNTQVRDYVAALEAFGQKYLSMIPETENANLDVTSVIVNPSFEQSNIQAKGWTVEGKIYIRANSSLTYATFGPAIRSAYYLQADANTKVSQTISDLRPGRYSLSAWLGAPDVTTTITLMAGEETASVQGNSFGKHYLTQTVVDEVLVGQDGTLTIAVTGNDTFFADDFHLTYLGVDASTPVLDVIESPVRRTSNAIYTISGQRVADMTRPGIYIVNGKKVLKK